MANEKYIAAVGRRKTATARVRLYDDKKQSFTINGQDIAAYLPTQEYINTAKSALDMSDKKNISVTAVVKGGGKAGQAEAIRHGISRALLKMSAELRPTLRAKGLLTRDPRRKERKKPGLRRARRAPQWSKR